MCRSNIAHENNVDAIEVVCATDFLFLPYCAAMIQSLIDCSEGERYHVNVMLDNDIPDEETNKLENYLSKHVGYRLYFISDEHIASISIPHAYLPRSVYFRLLLDKYIPSTVSKILFLDCDIFVFSSLRCLWETQLESNACGAVAIDYIDSGHLANIGFEDSSYFNAGVILLDLDEWRGKSLGELAAEWIVNNQSIAKFWDQDALNVIFHKNWKALDVRYNVTSMALESFSKRKEEPVIVHFTGRLKPWNYLSAHPFKNRYLNCLKRTPWKEAACVDYSVENMIRKYVPRVLLHAFSDQFRKKILYNWFSKNR